MGRTILIRRIRDAACAAVVLLALAACRGDAGDALAGFTPLPDSAASGASGELVDGSLEDALDAVRETTRRSGIPVSTQGELLGYAMDARRKSTQMRLDSNEFAQMLLTLGFPFEGRAARAGGSRRTMVDVLDPAEQSATRDELGQRTLAEHEARRADEDRAKAAHRARRDAITREPQARYEAAAEATRRLSKASREEHAANRDAVRQERTDARAALSEARARARELDEAFQQELGARRKSARLEADIARELRPNHEAGRQLMELLAAWVRAAAENPDHPDSFVPLYLAEMARRQSDPVDLAEAPPAHRHRWSLLEMAMFAAAFQPEPEPEAGARPLAVLMDALVPPAHATTPCEVAQEAFGSWKDVANTANGQASNFLMDQEFKRLWGEDAAKQMGKAISSMSIVGKVIKLAAFYAHTQVTVGSDVSQMHKPQGTFERVTFTARAGVPPEELEAYERAVKEAGLQDQAVRDCLGWAGLPHSDSIKDVAKDAENWTLDWRLFGDGKHANWSRRDNMDAKFFGGGRVGKPMKRVSESSTESKFVIRVLPERGHAGPLGTAKVEVRAEVDSAGLPSLETLVSAAKKTFGLGLAESLVEIASGWTREVFKPKAYAVVDLEFHCPDPTYILRYVKNPVADGGGDLSEGCTFTFDTREEFQEWKAGWE